jgi:hypothetical protein
VKMLLYWVPSWIGLQRMNAGPDKFMDDRTAARAYTAFVIFMYSLVSTTCGSKPIGAEAILELEIVVLLFIIEAPFALIVSAGKLFSAMIIIETKNATRFA